MSEWKKGDLIYFKGDDYSGPPAIFIIERFCKCGCGDIISDKLSLSFKPESCVLIKNPIAKLFI